MSVRTFYLGAGADAAFAQFHPAAGDTAVLFCPPFGWDDICSYRARREWALRLGAGGRPALRIDLPGAGDAGGTPFDPARLEAWTRAVSDAAAWLRGETGCRRLVAIGIGLGGMLAWRAASAGVPIDDMVLWGVPARGKAFVRELKAFARMEIGETPDGIPSPLPEGSLLSGGYALAPETIADLQALDLAALPLPALEPPRRVLLLGRDGVGADALAEPAAAAGAQVETDPGEGYGAMMNKPDETRPPRDVFARVDAWLAAAPEPAGTPPAAAAVTTSERLELDTPDGPVVEEPLTLSTPGGELPAILARPAEGATGDLALVLFNAGAVRRIGPNRLWVAAARRAAARGVPTVRLDFAGCGDADGDDTRWPDPLQFYTSDFVPQITGAFDELQRRGIAQRFLVSGLCSGGYWAFASGQDDERVVAAVPINPGLLIVEPDITVQRETRKLLKLIRPNIWRKILRGHFGWRDAKGILRALVLRPLRAARAVPARLRGTPAAASTNDRIDAALDTLRDRGVRLHFVIGADEPVKHELVAGGQLDRLSRWPNTSAELLPGSGRAHTLRPAQLQHLLLEELDAFVLEQRDGARAAA